MNDPSIDLNTFCCCATETTVGYIETDKLFDGAWNERWVGAPCCGKDAHKWCRKRWAVRPFLQLDFVGVLLYAYVRLASDGALRRDLHQQLIRQRLTMRFHFRQERRGRILLRISRRSSSILEQSSRNIIKPIRTESRLLPVLFPPRIHPRCARPCQQRHRLVRQIEPSDFHPSRKVCPKLC